MLQISRLHFRSLFICTSDALITNFKYLCCSIIISGLVVWPPQIDRKIPGVKYGCLSTQPTDWTGSFQSEMSVVSWLRPHCSLWPKDRQLNPHKAPFLKGSCLTAAPPFKAIRRVTTHPGLHGWLDAGCPTLKAGSPRQTVSWLWAGQRSHQLVTTCTFVALKYLLKLVKLLLAGLSYGGDQRR